jgi:hypothetical protein
MSDTERKGDWCVNSLGKRFYPMSPDPAAIDIRDIAHAESLMCRFGCKAKTFYSVAQHSVLASLWGPREIALELLLHDAGESLIGFDPPRPVKDGIAPEFHNIESGWLAAIDAALKLGGRLTNLAPEYKLTDNRMLMTEKRDVMPPCPDDWRIDSEPFPDKIIPWGPSFAEYAFLKRFAELTGDDHGVAANIAWHVQQYEAFLAAKSQSPIVGKLMGDVATGDLNELLALQIAVTALVKQNSEYRNYVNIQHLNDPRPSDVIIPKEKETSHD